MYDKETKTFHITGGMSWGIMILATIGLISIAEFFFNVMKIH